MKQILPVLLLAIGVIPVSGQDDSWHMQRVAIDPHPENTTFSFGGFGLRSFGDDQLVLTYGEGIYIDTGHIPISRWDEFSLIWTGSQFLHLGEDPETVPPGTSFSVTSNAGDPIYYRNTGSITVWVRDLGIEDSKLELITIDPVENQTWAAMGHRIDKRSLFFSIGQYTNESLPSSASVRTFSAYYAETWHVAEIFPEKDLLSSGIYELGEGHAGLLSHVRGHTSQDPNQYVFRELINNQYTYSHSLLFPTRDPFIAFDGNFQPMFTYIVNGSLILETLETIHGLTGLLFHEGLNRVNEILAFEIDGDGVSHIIVSTEVDEVTQIAHIQGRNSDWHISIPDGIGQLEELMAFQFGVDGSAHFVASFSYAAGEGSVNETTIAYLYFRDQSWGINTLPDAVDYVDPPTAAFDSLNIPHVAYSNSTWLTYATLSGNVVPLSNNLQQGIGSVKLLGKSLTEYDHWWWSPNFEFFSTKFYPWIFHNQLGWLFWFKGPGNGVYLYDLELGWLWASAEVLPHLYSFDQEEWMRAYPE